MSVVLRVSLFVMSLLSAFWILYNIRKAKVRIEDSVFWLCFSLLLICFSVFPGIVTWGASVLGIQSPVNFIFLAIIFVLIIKLFRMTIRVSQLSSKLQTLTQDFALYEQKKEK